MRPQVAYKETFTTAVDIDSKYAKQSGGRGQYGHCKVKFEPMDPNWRRNTFQVLSLPLSVVLFLRNTSQQSAKVSRKQLRLVSLVDSLYSVFMLLYVDGSYHEVDSSEMAFHIAGSMAFKDAMKKA